MMNKLANASNLTIIKKYIKNIQNINLDSIEYPCLPKFKSHLKIVELPYMIEQNVITLNIIEGILKKSHLFKDIMLASKLHIIKASSKSDIIMVWIDIWDFQSSSAVKNIINCQFNVKQFIATIHSTNINPSVLQCKNC